MPTPRIFSTAQEIERELMPSHKEQHDLTDRIPDSPLFVAEAMDKCIGLQGWVAIHSLGSSGSCGGIRLYPDVTAFEVKELARAMTYKYCFFERPMGGAKAGLVISVDAPREERSRLVRAFGMHIRPLLSGTLYNPWTDMNCGKEDLQALYNGAGLWNGGIGDSSYHTSLSTFAGLIAVAEYLGIPPSQCRVTIEGAGNVGTNLIREVSEWGAKVIGASTRLGAVHSATGLSPDEVVRSRNRVGDGWVLESGNWENLPARDLFTLDSNLHVPCARVHSLTVDIAQRIQCRSVVPAANVPATPDAAKELTTRGILLLPDFVINGGGIVGTGLADLGLSEDAVRRFFTRDFKDMCIRMLQMSHTLKTTPTEVASSYSHQFYGMLNRSATSPPGMGERIFHALAWRGLIPKSYRLRKTADQLVRIVNSRFSSTGDIRL
jgi:glutamate dehydrogenase/leucine dehydrogenase